MLIGVAAIWGFATPILKFTLGGISPFPFLVYRFAISAIFAFVFLLISGTKIPNLKKNILPISVYGILAFTLALTFLFLGLDSSNVLDLTLIGLAGPLVVTAGGVLFFHDKITHKERIGISIAVLGVLINSVYPIFTNTSVRLTGNILLILFLLLDSSAVLYSKKLVRHKLPPVGITMIGFIMGALTLIPLVFVIEGPQEIFSQIVNLEPQYHIGVWYLALVSGVLAYFLAINGEKSIEISEAWLFMYLQVIFTIPLAVFWLGESLSTSFIIGAVIIAIGIFIAEYKPKT